MKAPLRCALLGAASTLIATAPAFAQTAAQNDTSPKTASPTGPTNANGAGQAVGEIIVTAQRRDQSLSRTPVSVAVISADTLAKSQIVTEDDLRDAAPGLQIRSGGTSNQINYAIRGESQDPFSNVRPGVLPYINDVQIGGQGGASDFYDLQSVQVLKGPQGTLFGRSATGGAVLFTTQKPTDQFGGYISGLVGNYDAQKIEGAVNLPLIGDKLMLRVAGFERSRDGFQDNLYNNKNVGDQRQYGARISLTAKLNDKVKNELVVDYFHSNSQNTSAVISGLLPYTGVGAPYIPIQYLYSGTATPTATITGECTLQGFVGLGTCPPVNPAVAAFYTSYFSDPHHPANGISGQLAAQQARGPYVVDTDSSNIFRTNNTILTNTSTYDLGGGQVIKNILGVASIKSFTTEESDGTPYGAASGGPEGLGSDTQQFSDELQTLGKAFGDRLDYVAGLYYSDEKSTTDQVSHFFDLLFGGENQTNNFAITNTTYAAYGQGTYKLNDSGLAATLGARYTSERVGINVLSGDSFRQGLGNPAPPGYAYDQHTTYDRLSWTIGLQDQINPSLLVYADGRRAFKSGGYNGIVQPKVGDAGDAGDSYKAEQVTDAEVGSKFSGRVNGMRAHLNVDFYYSWIENSQRAAFTLVNGSPAGLTVNVPTGTTYGVEADGDIKPLNWLTLGSTLNYTKATFGNKPVEVNGQQQIFDVVPDTPKFTGSVYGEVSAPVSANLVATAHADLYYQSDSFTSPQSANNAGTRLIPYALTNFRVGIEDEQRGWSLTLNLKNAFDKVYYVGGVATGDIYQINFLIPGEPRTVTAEARLKF